MVNAIVDDCALVLDQFVGRSANTGALAEARAALGGVVENYRPWLVDNGNDDPGYKVAANGGTTRRQPDLRCGERQVHRGDRVRRPDR